MTEIKKSKASTSTGIMPKRATLKKIRNKTKDVGDKNEALSSVIRLSHIPYGFFERELKGYFTQFGKVRRVRVLRSKKGNFNGIAFVQFADIGVAEIAAETMDNYLMFDKRMRCRILKKKDVPKAIKTGKLYAKIPRKNGRKIKDAKIRFQPKSEYQEKHQLANFVKGLRQKIRKIKEAGIDYTYDFEAKLQKARAAKNEVILEETKSED